MILHAIGDMQLYLAMLLTPILRVVISTIERNILWIVLYTPTHLVGHVLESIPKYPSLPLNLIEQLGYIHSPTIQHF